LFKKCEPYQINSYIKKSLNFNEKLNHLIIPNHKEQQDEFRRWAAEGDKLL